MIDLMERSSQRRELRDFIMHDLYASDVRRKLEVEITGLISDAQRRISMLISDFLQDPIKEYKGETSELFYQRVLMLNHYGIDTSWVVHELQHLGFNPMVFNPGYNTIGLLQGMMEPDTGRLMIGINVLVLKEPQIIFGSNTAFFEELLLNNPQLKIIGLI